MVAAPSAVRVLEHFEQDTPARWIAYVGYFWMGLLFVFVASSLFLDLIGLLSSVVSKIVDIPLAGSFPTAGQSLLISIVIASAVVVYGAFEALDIHTEQVTLTTEKLPDGIIDIQTTGSAQSPGITSQKNDP